MVGYFIENSMSNFCALDEARKSDGSATLIGLWVNAIISMRVISIRL